MTDNYLPVFKYIINIRQFQRCNQKWTIQRNWQHRGRNTKTNKISNYQRNIWPYQRGNQKS